MRKLLCLVWLAAAAVPAAARVFPYAARKKTLPNGLDIVVIETPEFKSVLSYNTLVLAGSGREAGAGNTGLAHLFEHILFRHRYRGEDGGYDRRMMELGTHNNAWTWFDITYYHPLTFAANLSALMELESSRFKALDFTEKTFKTETGAVLGEYRKDASQPSFKLDERLGALMYPGHPYGHTTIGFYQDVVDMPGHYEAARKFYDAYYRPNNCALIVVGDVKAEEVFSKAEPFYADWKSQPAPPRAPDAPSAGKEQKESAGWDSDVAPILWVSYRMPAFAPGTAESAAAQLLGELTASPAAPLYKKLRYEKQTASELSLGEGGKSIESDSPRFLTISAQLYKEKLAARGAAYFDEAAADIEGGLDDLKSFSKSPGAAELLSRLKSKYRYDFLAGLESPESIASTFAWYYRFGRDPEVLDKLLAAVDSLKPEDIDALAQKRFTPENRVVLTLSYQAGKGGAQ